MTTFNQLTYKNCRKKKKKLNKSPALEGNPQARGVCMKLATRAPKKPNSAKRKIAKVRLNRIRTVVEVYLPGVGFQLQQFAVLLIRGGRVKDLPGCKYHAIRGKFDFKGVAGRKTSRSLYGVRRKK